MNIEIAEKQKRYRIPASMQIDPCHQGNLDGLCGIYAIINAIRIAAYGYCHDSHSTNHALFVDALGKLEDRGPIKDFVTDGMSKSDFRALTTYLCKKASNSKVRLKCRALPVRAPAAERRDNLLAALAAGFPILVDLEHRYHYSVAIGFTPGTLTLFDSYGYTRTHFSEDRPRRAIVIEGAPMKSSVSLAKLKASKGYQS